MLKRLLNWIRRKRNNRRQNNLLAQYNESGKLPWSPGYDIFKWRTIQSSLESLDVLSSFEKHEQLPDHYGDNLDERVVEYPWLFSRLRSGKLRTLDAGSALNFSSLINKMCNLQRDMTVYTLAPESQAYWKKQISYHYGDLRQTPFRDHWFDEIISISTLEHIGSDNALYVDETEGIATDQQGFIEAAKELWRILKPGGSLYITIPYGVDETIHIGDSVFMRQFDRNMLRQLIDCFPGSQISLNFFKYSSIGWNISTQSECDTARYYNIHEHEGFDKDFAAAARAVCCIQVIRELE